MTGAAEGEADAGAKDQDPELVDSWDSVDDIVDTPDPVPRWRAMFFISLNRQRRPVLGDTGCNRSCMSYEYFVNNPCFKQSFKPEEGCGVAINGSEVPSIGSVRFKFRLGGVAMVIGCRVVKGLMDPVILGWDWMNKYSVMLNTEKGEVQFCRGRSAPLIEDESVTEGWYYKALEDLTLPPNSKVHVNVELAGGKDPLDKGPAAVIAEPFTHMSRPYHAARTCSTVKNGCFMTEFINTSDNCILVPAGEVIGHVQFANESEFGSQFAQTEMFCSYRSAHESPQSPEDSPPPQPSPPEEDSESPPNNQTPPTDPSGEPSPKLGALRDDGIPPGAKPLKIDLSAIAEDARPYKDRLHDLLENQHAAAFSKHDRDYGRTHLIQYRAHIKDPDQNPISQPPYRTRPEMREVIDAQAHEMIADGLVGPSTSSYSAPILLARKKCGGWRFLTDFRKVNECCSKVVYPLPRIEDSIQRLENPRFFTSMDLTKGFWQIPIHPDDRKFFAFSTESMHLEYLVAPMGAKNSPSYLSKLMQLVLRGLPIQHVISYLDDILVADTNMEDHLRHLDLVLSALEKAGLKLNPAKCAFARDSVVCLGHRLSRDGVSPDPANVEKIRSWKAPDNVKKLRAFLGLTGYYRQFVEGYSEIAKSLTELTRDDVKWTWGPEQQKAFETLRDTLISEQIMSYPDFTKPFIVKCDASLTSIGYVLTQRVDNKERVISYGSKKLSRQQQRWSTYDREFFALIAAVRANAHYLRHNRFMVVTDHRPLLAWRKVDSRKDPTGRRTRWAIELDNYDFDLVYKKGKTHCDADAMSRRGDDDDEVAEDSEEFFGLRFLFDEPEVPAPAPVLCGMREDNETVIVSLQADDDAREKLRQAQDEDTIIAEVKAFVKARRRLPRSFPGTWFRRNAKWFVMRDQILYRRSYSQVIHADVLQAVIPDAMIDEILADLHGSNWSGHPGVAKMTAQVQRFATWPSMAHDIKKKVRECATCDQLREEVPKPQTPLQPIVATAVFDHVMCDLISFPIPSKGFKYVLVFKDVFSGFVRCYKLRDKTTNGVVKSLEDLVCLLGPPRQLTSDNGGEFTSSMLKEACKQLGIEKRTGVPYRPQSQGNVERQNRTLIKDLQQRLLQFGSSWSDHLPYAEWLHNTTPFSKTNMTPYFLFFGREAYLPQFVERSDVKAEDPKCQRFADEMKEKLHDINAEANRRAAAKREKEASVYDRRSKHQPFEAGDRVWERADVRHKLQPRWSGPIEVKSRRKSPTGEPGTTYICERPDGTTCKRNYEQLKRVNAKFDEDMKQPPSPQRKPKVLSGAEIFALIHSDRRPRPPPEPPVGENADGPHPENAIAGEIDVPMNAAVDLGAEPVDAAASPLGAAAPASPLGAAAPINIAVAPVIDATTLAADAVVPSAQVVIPPAAAATSVSGDDTPPIDIAMPPPDAATPAIEPVLLPVDNVAPPIDRIVPPTEDAAPEMGNSAETTAQHDVVGGAAFAADDRWDPTSADDPVAKIPNEAGSVVEDSEDGANRTPRREHHGDSSTATDHATIESINFDTTYDETGNPHWSASASGGSLPSIASNSLTQEQAGRLLSEESVAGEVDMLVNNELDLSVAGPSRIFKPVTPMPSTPIDSNPTVGMAPDLRVSPLSLSDDALDSPGFYTPLLRNLQLADEEGSDSTPRNPPVAEKPTEQQTSGKARRRINMPADVVTHPSSPLPMDQRSGEVKSEPSTPIMETNVCEAMTVFVDDCPSGYLVKSPDGQIIVPNLTTGQTDLPPSGPHFQALPGTSGYNQGAIRTRETRSKVAYRPYSKPIRSQSDPGDGDKIATRPKREINAERGPDGKFRKKPQ